jgi:hypothetical protein
MRPLRADTQVRPYEKIAVNLIRSCSQKTLNIHVILNGA